MNASLRDLQAHFQAHVLGDAAEDFSAASTGEPGVAQQRLGIYVDAYRLRLAETLADAYPKTAVVLGEARFERACLRYIVAHTPEHRSLRWYGAHLADRLAEWVPASPQWAELARLEWALRNAFDGADAPALDASALAVVPAEAWAHLHVVLHPTAELLTMQHNTVAVWQAVNDEQVPPDFERGRHAVTWLVWRKELQPHFRSLGEVEAALLGAIVAGHSFAQACEAAAPWIGDDAAAIGVGLRQWFDEGLLSGIDLTPR